MRGQKRSTLKGTLDHRWFGMRGRRAVHWSSTIAFHRQCARFRRRRGREPKPSLRPSADLPIAQANREPRHQDERARAFAGHGSWLDPATRERHDDRIEPVRRVPLRAEQSTARWPAEPAVMAHRATVASACLAGRFFGSSTRSTTTRHRTTVSARRRHSAHAGSANDGRGVGPVRNDPLGPASTSHGSCPERCRAVGNPETCVSTASVGWPTAMLRTTLAVLRPTPCRASALPGCAGISPHARRRSPATAR